MIVCAIIGALTMKRRMPTHGDRLMLRRLARAYAAEATQAKRRGKYGIGLERLREERK